MDVPMVSATLRWSFAPVAVAINIVAPDARLSIAPVMVCMTWLPTATPETLAASSNQPTTNKSAPPYSACKQLANKKGIANFSNTFGTLPRVKSSSFILVVSINTVLGDLFELRSHQHVQSPRKTSSGFNFIQIRLLKSDYKSL